VSLDKVEIVKRSMDAVTTRDLNGYDEFATPDFEWFPALPGSVGGGLYRGREGMETYVREIGEVWESFRPVYDEWHDLGNRLLALGRYEARGRGSGVPVQAPLGGIYDFRDGKMWRCRNYLDHGEALRAAGLSE
jgi:ketosteroid isomerase-like protein